MVAEFKELYDTIVNSETFHSWFAKNPKVQLSHFFAQINQNYIPTSAWDLGFFNPEDEKITVFTLNEANEIIQKNTDDVFKQKQANSLVKKVGTIDQSLQKLVSSETANKQSNQLIACNNIKQLTMYSIQGL